MTSIRKEKRAIVQGIVDKFSSSKAFVVFSYHGLTVNSLQKLRYLLSENNAELKIYKNRLVKIAAKKSGFEDLNNYLIGPNAFVFGYDNSTPAKIINEFIKENKEIRMITGLYEDQVVNDMELLSIAMLPSYEEALTILARSMMTPLHKIALGLKMYVDDVLSSKNGNKESLETKPIESQTQKNMEVKNG